MYDVIICGAGPAGSMAARILALNGYDVLLIEKEKLPRYKACGGGLTKKCYDLLDFDISDLIEDKTYKVTLLNGGKYHYDIDRGNPMIYMVKRDKFDKRLVDKALEVGVTLHQKEKVIDLKQYQDRVDIITDKGKYSAKYVIAADGVLSIIRKKLGLKNNYGLALEAEINADELLIRKYHGSVKINFDAIKGGYAWIFPKSDSLSMGVGTFIKNGNNLMEALNEFLEFEGIAPHFISVKGHPIALNNGVYNAFSAGRVLFTGDAAMLTDPFTGEGIYYAIKSSIIAAKYLKEALMQQELYSFKKYDREISYTFLKDIKIASKVARFFYNNVDLSFKLLKKCPGAFNHFVGMVCGEESYTQIPITKLLTFGRG